MEANQSFLLEIAEQCHRRDNSTGHMALEEAGERKEHRE